MPHKRRKSTMKQKNKKDVISIIRERLMVITVQVDNLIYKHKPIAVEDAQKYLNEMSHYKTQCHNDVHILQVIEKFTKYMKNIIEGAKKLSLQQNTISPYEISADMFSESSDNSKLPKNMFEGKNNTKLINSNKFEQTPIVITENRSAEIVSSKVQINEQRDLTEQSVHNAQQNALCMADGSINLKTIENNKQLNSGEPYGNYMKNNLESICDNIHITQIECVTQAHIDSINIKQLKNEPVRNRKYRACRKTIAIDSLRLSPTKIKEQVHTVKTINQSHVTRNNTETPHNLQYQTNNNVIMFNKIQEIQGKGPKPKRRRTTVPKPIRKRTTNVHKPNTAKEDNSIKNGGNVRPNKTTKNDSSPSLLRNFTIPNEKHNTIYKNTRADLDSHDVPFAVVSYDNGFRNKLNDERLISTQMASLKIHSDCVEHDLSWIENIRYVREVSLEEFEPSQITLSTDCAV